MLNVASLEINTGHFRNNMTKWFVVFYPFVLHVHLSVMSCSLATLDVIYYRNCCLVVLALTVCEV